LDNTGRQQCRPVFQGNNMPTNLTAPIVRQSLNVATLDGWSLSLVRKTDGTLDIDPAQSVLRASLTMRDADGQMVEVRALERNVNQLPTALKNLARSLHDGLITALRNGNQLPVGTDVADF
jgi:hypothetical protein